MHKFCFGLCFIFTAISLGACSGKSTENRPETNIETLPSIEMVSTHAIDTKTQIKALTFVPNNVAPWLGRIILLDENNHLFSTDIEGRSPLVISPKEYRDIIGLTRSNVAGVFLTISTDNNIEAFIQSDDAGNYALLSINSPALKITAFCKSTSPQETTIQAISLDGKILKLDLSIQDNTLEITNTGSVIAPEIKLMCSSIQLSSTDHADQNNGHFIVTNTSEKPANKRSVSIKNGLSIQGMTNVHYVNGTYANYGGGAFKNGVVSLIDHTEKRIVFMSLEYVNQQIAANNKAR